MTYSLSDTALAWARGALGADVKVLSVKSLNVGRGPWLLRVDRSGQTRDVVLRVGGRITTNQIVTGAAALRCAEEHGLPAPRLIASDLDGRVTGTPATLETAVPGSSVSPAQGSPERLRAAGAAIAKVHQVPLAPQRDLPFKVRSLQARGTLDDQEAMVRRWATLYRASSDPEKPAVVDALSELTGLPADRAHRLIRTTHSTPLLQLADDVLREYGTPQGETVFVHADLHPGNMMWDGDTSVVLIDWKDAGVGNPGVDLGHLRMQMALWYGAGAPAHVLEGWQRETGREATDLPYWDAVAAVHTPTDFEDWGPFGFDEQGKPLVSGERTGRRDAFLRAALDQLGDPAKI